MQSFVDPRKPAEKAILLAALLRDDPRRDNQDPLEELASLADTAGVVVLDRVVQRRDKPDPATYVGKGTVERLKQLVIEKGADTVISENELSPGQVRNLEKALEKKVVDRTELILDIFAGHARTPQSKLQVELAQLEYALPRLRKMWSHLGGVGFRGPGETQLESDKRLIREKIHMLRRGLEEIRARKEREVKTRAEAFTVAIVGYTNAGKSTLMNALTGAGVYVADQLFATLDTRTRPWKVANRKTVLLSDTVGFIDHLPHHLVESFHATLEEVVTADLLLHVIDASREDGLAQHEAVKRVLEQIGCKDRPEVTVLNKCDKVGNPELLPWVEQRVPRPVRVSAKTGEGLDKLAQVVAKIASEREGTYEVSIDVREGAAIAAFESLNELESKRLDGETMKFTIHALPDLVRRAAARARDRSAVVLKEIAPPAASTASSSLDAPTPAGRTA